MAVDPTLIEQLQEFDTPTVAESLLALGCPDNHKYFMGSDVRLLTRVPEPIVGVVRTLVVDTSTPGLQKNRDGLIEATNLARESDLPTVVVMKSVGSRLQHECIAGDGMGKMFRAAGIVGIVGNGAARDIDALTRLGFAVFGSGVVCDHATLHYTVTTKPVTISGVTITNGDLIHADNNGVHIVPSAYHHAIIEACCLTCDFERRAHVINRRSDLSATRMMEQVTILNKVRGERCAAAMRSEE
jgi:regulator of RNase E activity RraA